MSDDGNRWGQHPVAPPSLAGAVVVVRSQRHLLWRAALPFGVIGLVLCWAGAHSNEPAPGLGAGGALLALSALRVIFWANGMASRTVLATPTHLVLCQRDRPRHWIEWSAVEELFVTSTTFLPEWSRNGAWFQVFPMPSIAVQPPMAIVGGFGEMLISRRASAAAADRVRAAAAGHAVPVEAD